MQCDLLVSNFKDPKTIGFVKDNIKRISDGSSSHCAGALKLGLKKAFEKNGGVKLQCSYSGCPYYNSHVPYLSVGSTYYCQTCTPHGWNHWLRCAGCGCSRTGAYSVCQNCKKMFI